MKKNFFSIKQNQKFRKIVSIIVLDSQCLPQPSALDATTLHLFCTVIYYALYLSRQLF